MCETVMALIVVVIVADGGGGLLLQAQAAQCLRQRCSLGFRI